MKTIELTVQTYNLIPATARRTVGTERHALVNGEWRIVTFVR